MTKIYKTCWADMFLDLENMCVLTSTFINM